jgi:hypothetical protein
MAASRSLLPVSTQSPEPGLRRGRLARFPATADPPESNVTGVRIRAGQGGSPARCELVAGGRSADRPPN